MAAVILDESEVTGSRRALYGPGVSGFPPWRFRPTVKSLPISMTREFRKRHEIGPLDDRGEHLSVEGVNDGKTKVHSLPRKRGGSVAAGDSRAAINASSGQPHEDDFS